MHASTPPHLRRRMHLRLLLKRAGDASAIEVCFGNLWPLIDTVEDGKRHAAVHVGLHVTVHEPGAGELDVVAQRHPGAVAFRRGGGVAISVCGGMVSDRKMGGESGGETYKEQHAC